MEDDDGWEILQDDGFLHINDDGGKKIFSRNYGAGAGAGCVFKDYFICPDSKSTKFVENTEEKVVVEEEEEEGYPVKIIQLGNPPDHNQEDFKKINEVPFEKTINSSPPPPPPLLLPENLKEPNPDPDSDPVSLLKKMMEQEFVDMKKLEPPIRSMKPPPFPAAVEDQDAATLQLTEVKRENLEVEVSSPRLKNGGFNFNIWKWSLTTGIGAICSFGFATATVCIIFFGAAHHHNRNSDLQQSQENHKLKFHIYSDQKGLKEEAASRRSVSMNRDRDYYTFGGYYDEA